MGKFDKKPVKTANDKPKTTVFGFIHLCDYNCEILPTSNEKRENMLQGLEKSSKKLLNKKNQKKEASLANTMRKLRKARKCQYTGSYSHKNPKAGAEVEEETQEEPAYDDCDEAKIHFYKSLRIQKRH